MIYRKKENIKIIHKLFFLLKIMNLSGKRIIKSNTTSNIWKLNNHYLSRHKAFDFYHKHFCSNNK